MLRTETERLILVQAEARLVSAHTLPELAPSIRILEKCGFSHVGAGQGAGQEEGILRYELARPPQTGRAR